MRDRLASTEARASAERSPADARRQREPSRPTGQSNAEVFPDIDASDAHACSAFERIAERAEIADEYARLVGRTMAVRASVGALGADLRGFIARTWLIWLIVGAVTVVAAACGR